MLGAVLEGGGLQGLAQLAWEEAGCPIEISLPSRGLAALAPLSAEPAGKRRSEEVAVEEVAVEVPIFAGRVRVGAVRVFAGANGDRPEVDCEEVARAAALAAVAQLAVSEARDEVEHELRASLIEDLRAGASDDVLRRAGRLGCRPTDGGFVLAAEIRTSKPDGVIGLIETDWPGALAELLAGRVYAILPAGENAVGGEESASAGEGEDADASAAEGEDPEPSADDAEDAAEGVSAEAAPALARRLVSRLRAHGPTAVSSFYADPAELHLAVREAELVLDVIRTDQTLAAEIEGAAGDGVYRLLFRALISQPEEVRSFYDDTVAPLVTYDEQYRSDLMGTLEAYLANDCNMNATARSIYAHRHTVAYRLDRIKELSGLDPGSSSDRERLGLGIKAFRILGSSVG